MVLKVSNVTTSLESESHSYDSQTPIHKSLFTSLLFTDLEGFAAIQLSFFPNSIALNEYMPWHYY